MSGISTGRGEGKHTQIEKMLHVKKYSWGTIGSAEGSKAIEVFFFFFSSPRSNREEPGRRDWEQLMSALNARLKNPAIIL